MFDSFILLLLLFISFNAKDFASAATLLSQSNLTFVLETTDAQGMVVPELELLTNGDQFNRSDLLNVRVALWERGNKRNLPKDARFTTPDNKVSVSFTFVNDLAMFKGFKFQRPDDMIKAVEEYYYFGKTVYHERQFDMRLKRYQSNLLKLPFEPKKTIFPYYEPQNTTITIKFLRAPQDNSVWNLFGVFNKGTYVSRFIMRDQSHKKFARADFKVADAGNECEGGDILDAEKEQILYCRYGLELKLSSVGNLRRVSSLVIETKKFPWYALPIKRTVRLGIAIEYSSQSKKIEVEYSDYNKDGIPVSLEYV